MRKIFIAILLVSLIVGCTSTQVDDSNNSKGVNSSFDVDARYDVVDDDIVALMDEENISSWNVSVKGVELNDSRKEVLNVLGSPDNYTRFEGEGLVIENLEYGEAWGFNSSGIIVHLENDRVTRITVNDVFNKNLINRTILNSSKKSIFFNFGVPESKDLLYRFIVYNYPSSGLEIITLRGEEIAFSLVPPGEVNRNYTTNKSGEKVYYPYSDEIKLQ